MTNSRTAARRFAGVLVVSLALAYGAQAVRQYGQFTAGEAAGLPTFLRGDGRFYRATLLSMTQDHSLDVRPVLTRLGYRPESNVSLGRRGEWYPKHALPLALAALPFFVAAGDVGLLAFNITQAIVLTLLIWYAARAYTTDAVALGIAWWFAFGSLIRPASYDFSPDLFGAILVLGAYLSVTQRRTALAGGLLGLAAWARLTNIVMLPIAFAYAFSIDRRGAVRLALGATLALAVFAMFNLSMYGSPITTSYDRVVAGFSQGRPMLEPSHRTFFDVAFFDGLWSQIFDRQIGLLVSAPMILLLIPGLSALQHRNPAQAALIGTLIVTQILLFAPYRLWNQSTYGHRFLMGAIVLSAVPIAALCAELFPRPEARA